MSEQMHGKDLKVGDIFYVLPNFTNRYRLLERKRPQGQHYCTRADEPGNQACFWIELVWEVELARHPNSNV